MINEYAVLIQGEGFCFGTATKEKAEKSDNTAIETKTHTVVSENTQL